MNEYAKILIFLFLLNISIINIYKVFNNKKESSQIVSNNSIKRVIKDVLFINGCQKENLPHPYRYRILHQIEQLNVGNLECFELYYSNLNPAIVLDFRVIILYRTPWTESINQAIELANILNKKVLYDRKRQKSKKKIVLIFMN
jgi:hypothetical protein